MIPSEQSMSQLEDTVDSWRFPKQDPTIENMTKEGG